MSAPCSPEARGSTAQAKPSGRCGAQLPQASSQPHRAGHNGQLRACSSRSLRHRLPNQNEAAPRALSRPTSVTRRHSADGAIFGLTSDPALTRPATPPPRRQARAASPAAQARQRVHHRPRPSLQVQVVEGTQHALGVRPGRGRVSHRRRRLPGDRVDRILPPAPNPGPARPRRARSRLGRQLNPPAEIPGLRPGRLVPPNPRCPQETEPAQQVHPVRPLRGGRPPARLKLPQIHRDRTDNYPVRIDEPVRL
jgi:hypothetical protein